MSPPTPGAELLDDICAYLRRFVVLDANQAAALALWVAHTHALDAAAFTPYIAITSAEKESGKSTLLTALRGVTREPRGASNATTAALFRMIEEYRPTLFLDELDAMLAGNKERAEEIRGILNAGFVRDGEPVYRCAGPNHQLATFDTFCPKALAGIGDLPDTLAGRSIRIRLRRARPDERHDDIHRVEEVRPLADALHERAAAWAEGSLGELAAYRLHDLDLKGRARNLWQPLIAVADAAGGDWPARARAAALHLNGQREDAEASTGVRLLADLQRIRDEDGGEAMFSAAICKALNAREESSWGGWNNGAGIAPRDLARRLRDYDVAPGTVRVGADTGKGYRWARLADAFARYLPSEAPAEPALVTDGVTDCDGKCDGQIPVNYAGCDGVTAKSPPGDEDGLEDDLSRWNAMATEPAA